LVEDRGGKRRYWLALRELLASERASIITDTSGPRADDKIDVAGVVLANLTTRQLAKVTERARHVREVLTGFRSGSAEICEPGEPRKEYSPQLPLGERYCAKADELGVRKRTVERWVRAYREHGEAGLAALSRGKPQGRTDERWVELAEDVMVENAEMSRPNKHSVIQQTRA
jgi:transposase-like protein